MKVNLENLTPRQRGEVEVGNLYPGKGGRGNTMYWLVVALTEQGCCLLGLNAVGEVVSTASYNQRAMRERALIGRVEGLVNLTFEIEGGAG